MDRHHFSRQCNLYYNVGRTPAQLAVLFPMASETARRAELVGSRDFHAVSQFGAGEGSSDEKGTDWHFIASSPPANFEVTPVVHPRAEQLRQNRKITKFIQFGLHKISTSHKNI